MESPNFHGPSNPLLSLSTVIHQHCHRLGAELATRFEDTKRLAGNLAANFPPVLAAATAAAAQRRLRTPAPPPSSHSSSFSSPFASLTQEVRPAKHVFDVALSTDQVAKTLAGTAVYTVSNSNNEFVLISDPNALKSIGLLCFRQEDAEAFLAQVRTRKRELKSQAKVVPITLDQVYMLKVEGIAFRFLPDPVQIKNAIELKAADIRSGFDGVPVFQSDLLTVKRKNKRYCPIYFRKEDIENELLKVSRASRGPGVSQHIMIEHAQHLVQGTTARFGQQGIIASVQPDHLLDDADSATKKLGKEKANKGSYLFRSLLSSSARLAFGSDWPVASINPLGSIKTAMKRIPPGWENAWASSECISLNDALNAYTISAAHACFLDNDFGSLSPGKLADFVVLTSKSWNDFAMESVNATYVGGIHAYP